MKNYQTPDVIIVCDMYTSSAIMAASSSFEASREGYDYVNVFDE